MTTPVTDDSGESMRLVARAWGTRQRLEALLLEALLAPRMARPQVERICEMAESGELAAAEDAMEQLEETA